MKKLLILALAIFLLSCSKNAKEDAPVSQVKYFSVVNKYTDGRTPAVDTVWTLMLYSKAMVDSFSKYDGYIYAQTNAYKQVGILWTR